MQKNNQKTKLVYDFRPIFKIEQINLFFISYFQWNRLSGAISLKFTNLSCLKNNTPQNIGFPVKEDVDMFQVSRSMCLLPSYFILIIDVNPFFALGRIRIGLKQRSQGKVERLYLELKNALQDWYHISTLKMEKLLFFIYIFII